MALLRRPVPATPPGGGQGKTLRWFCLPQVVPGWRRFFTHRTRGTATKPSPSFAAKRLELPIPRRFPKETILPGGVIELVDGLWLLPPLLSAKEGLGLGLGPSGRGTSSARTRGRENPPLLRQNPPTTKQQETAANKEQPCASCT